MDNTVLVCWPQEKDIYRWPIRDTLRSMLAMGWVVDRSKDGESMSQQSEKMRKISQASQVGSIATPEIDCIFLNGVFVSLTV